MELTKEEHVKLSNAYANLAQARKDILDRTFDERYKKAGVIREDQSIAVAEYFQRKKANIDILEIKGYVGEYYNSPKV